MSPTAIENRIRRLRFDRNEMTQQDLAEKVGVTRQTINAIELGKYSPSLEVAFRMLRAKAHIGIGGEMEYDVAALDGACQRLEVQRVAFHERERRVLQRTREKGALPCRKVVVSDDGVAEGEEAIDQ